MTSKEREIGVQDLLARKVQRVKIRIVGYVKVICRMKEESRSKKFVWLSATLLGAITLWFVYQKCNNVDYCFYNKWLDLIFIRSLPVLQVLLAIWLVWQLTHGKGIRRVLRWLIVPFQSVCALLLVFLWFFSIDDTTQKKLLDDHQETFYMRVKSDGTKIEGIHLRNPSIIADEYEIVMTRPVISGVVYGLHSIWQGTHCPEKQVLDAIN